MPYNRSWNIIKFFLVIFLQQAQPLRAQICVDDYFAINFKSSTVQNRVAMIAASNNEMLMAGNVFRYNSLLQAGWLTRFSAQGSILWSKQYYTGTFNFLNFTNIIPADDENYFITGNIGDVDTTVWPLAHLTEYGLLLKVDKYGNIIWSKILSNIIRPYTFSNINSIDKAKDGSIVLSLSCFTTKQYTAVMHIQNDGNIIWTSLISSSSRNTGFGNSRLKILSNGNIAIAYDANVSDEDYSYQRKGYCFVCLDGETGDKIWNSFFLNRDTLSLGQAVLGSIENITELPNHNISFITSYASAPVRSAFRKTDKILNFITDGSGIFKQILSYSTTTSSIYASSVTESGDGNRLILMDNGDSSFMIGINVSGEILWQKGYALIGRGQETNCILSTGFGSYFFSSTNNGGSTDPKLIKTDITGNAPCIESSFQATMQDITSSFFMQNLRLDFEKTSGAFSNLTCRVYDYAIQGNDICRISCCHDVTDTADEIKLCNMLFYILPNKDTVKNSGTYTATYKTSKGCDSIVYYNVNFNFTPTVSLGADTCFGSKDSLVLKALPDYSTYTWNGTASGSNKFVVSKPGIYTLMISNECGMKADTINIFKQCAFDIFMPNAFTPNGDGLNDLFRIPLQNYNRLISFTIYNRWGEKIFTTQNISNGWNGMNKEYPAATGTYVYIIVMKSLDNKSTFTKKGYVTLIR
ncbi:MAG TPA: gliding motility-associated C-terminal domain-containing protein [Parafilimonas sp.]|nr:gliding motility-associated C-terminal domain-containing protein [Parafilimonas sp.]